MPSSEENEGNVEVPQEETPSTPLVDDKGNLRDGWTGILDEELRDSPFLKESKTLQGIAKSVVNARSMVGRDKITKPNDASTEDEWNEWYKAGGRPENFSDYGFEKPEELPDEYYDQQRAEKYMKLFHKIGLSATQAKTLFDAHNEDVISELKQVLQQRKLSDTELRDGLRADWGNAYEQKKHFGNLAIEKGSQDEEHKQRMVEKYGNDPDFIRFAANIGGLFNESSVPNTPAVPTPSDIQEQIDEAQAHPAYGPEYAKHGFTKQQHRVQVNKVQQLFNQRMVSQRKTG